MENRNKELHALVCPSTFPNELVIYYGSQTGNAEKFAHVLDEEAHTLHINSRVVDLEKFNPEEFCTHKLSILVIATHYEGDPTDNAKTFHKWLKNSVKNNPEEKLLNNMEYCVMGLGDTSYEQFNEMAIFCDKSLNQLGAKRHHAIGAANAETYTTEDDF